MNERKKGFASAFTQAFVVGFALYATKTALSVAPTLDVLAHRFTLAAIGGIMFGLVTKRLKFDKSHLKTIVLLSFLFPIGFFFFQTSGLNYIPSAEASAVISFTPIFVVILACIFLGESIDIKQIFLLVLAVAGVILLESKGFGGDNFYLLGGALILICSLSHAIYDVALKRFASSFPAYEIACVVSICGAIFFNTLNLTSHFIHGTLDAYFIAFNDKSFTCAILFLGLFSSFGSSLFLSYALARVEAGKVSVISSLSSVVGVIAGVWIGGETLSTRDWIGVIAVLIGVIGFSIVSSQKSKNRRKI